ncbi:hypothetical protein FACS1894147_05200 [Spirochaetia bacterium]|nr:hypothetical protein FACS1894147_05200 [Spirochaetia bacterium]
MARMFNAGYVDAKITFTNRCSARCVTCLVGNIPEKDYSDLKPETFKKFIRELIELHNKKIRVVHFFNIGESYLHPKFIELVEWAIPLLKKEHIKTTVTTNGSHVLKIPMNVDSFCISFNAGKKETYEYITKLNFDKVYNNILNLYKSREYKKAKSFQIHMLCFDKNSGEEENLKKLFNGMKDVRLRFSYKYDNQLNKTQYTGTVERPTKLPCDYITNKINLHSNGDIVLCAHDFFASTSFGNMESQSLKDILNSPKRLEMIKEHNSLQFNGLCKDCDYNTQADTIDLVYTWADEKQNKQIHLIEYLRKIRLQMRKRINRLRFG